MREISNFGKFFPLLIGGIFSTFINVLNSIKNYIDRLNGIMLIGE